MRKKQWDKKLKPLNPSVRSGRMTKARKNLSTCSPQVYIYPGRLVGKFHACLRVQSIRNEPNIEAKTQIDNSSTSRKNCPPACPTFPFPCGHKSKIQLLDTNWVSHSLQKKEGPKEMGQWRSLSPLSSRFLEAGSPFLSPFPVWPAIRYALRNTPKKERTKPHCILGHLRRNTYSTVSNSKYRLL